MVVAVTGALGQLGQALQEVARSHKDISFYFLSSDAADITQIDALREAFDHLKPDFCINAAAYTAVDKAEAEPDKAFFLNADGAKNLASVCKLLDITLIHISTDFVFDGKVSKQKNV